MTKVLLAAAMIVATATPALAIEQREAALLKALPVKAQIKAENKADWLHRVHVRRQERRAAARAARAAAASEPTVASVSPVPPATFPAGVLSAEQVAAYARAAGFPESVIPTMVAIAYRESTFCPTAVYGYGCAGSGHAYEGGPACGLFQIFECPGPEALNPAVNASMAYAKYQASGLSPWGM